MWLRCVGSAFLIFTLTTSSWTNAITDFVMNASISGLETVVIVRYVRFRFRLWLDTIKKESLLPEKQFNSKGFNIPVNFNFLIISKIHVISAGQVIEKKPSSSVMDVLNVSVISTVKACLKFLKMIGFVMCVDITQTSSTHLSIWDGFYKTMRAIQLSKWLHLSKYFPKVKILMKMILTIIMLKMNSLRIFSSTKIFKEESLHE